MLLTKDFFLEKFQKFQKNFKSTSEQMILVCIIHKYMILVCIIHKYMILVCIFHKYMILVCIIHKYMILVYTILIVTLKGRSHK